MPDITLHGNGAPCPGCALRRASDVDLWGPSTTDCNACGGVGRIARPIENIIADHVAWAREHYWPGRFQ